jgi:hypothetical protein
VQVVGVGTHDLVRYALRLTRALLVVGRAAIDLGRVEILVETRFDAEELLVRRELVPSLVTACRAVAKRKVVGWVSTGRQAGRLGLPRLQLALAAARLAADICIGLKSWTGRRTGAVTEARSVGTSTQASREGGSLSPPAGGWASAGPDDHLSMLVEATNCRSLRGAPGAPRSLASLRVTPVVSPSAPVDATTPSQRWPVLVMSVMVVPVSPAIDASVRSVSVRGTAGAGEAAPLGCWRGGKPPPPLGLVGSRAGGVPGEKVGDARAPVHAGTRLAHERSVSRVPQMRHGGDCRSRTGRATGRARPCGRVSAGVRMQTCTGLRRRRRNKKSKEVDELSERGTQRKQGNETGPGAGTDKARRGNGWRSKQETVSSSSLLCAASVRSGEAGEMRPLQGGRGRRCRFDL